MQKKHSTGKNSIVGVITGSLCILVYLAALVSAAMKMYSSIEQRSVLADREFYDIADLAASAGVLGFMDGTFIETIDDALAASVTLEAIIISGPNGEYAFERDRGKAVNWVNDSPRFRKRFDFLRQPLYQSLVIQDLRNVNIEARAGAIDYTAFTGILKQTLIIVVTALAAAFLCLMIENFAVRERQTSGDFETDELRQSRFSQAPPSNSAPQPEPYGGEQRLKAGSAAQEAPRGLFAPSGVGWEDYTSSRLDSELYRCAASEEDVVFIAIAAKNELPAGFYRKLTAEAIRFFTLRDLIFEKGGRGITIIIPGADLKTGFTKSAEFHSRILNKHPEIFTSTGDLCIGLSSRSGRLIDAKRLMLETDEALTRALTDPASHIIAFKTDPEKYRAYISSRS